MVPVIGLMSGTSVDGIDAALVDIIDREGELLFELLASQTFPFTPEVRSRILSVINGAFLTMAEVAELDDSIAGEFAQAALKIQRGHPRAQLIGSHGQTVYHRPPHQNAPLGYSWQLGRGELIAYLTKITTVSNFRLEDIAASGTGAPLVPIVDACLLSHATYHRCIQNIGGIGNVTYLPPLYRRPKGKAEPKKTHPIPNSPVLNPYPGVRGWDTGPGNALLDLAVQYLSQGAKTYDENGDWAALGTPNQSLVAKWLQHPFFQQKPPKSTGRELFSLEYLKQCLTDAEAEKLSPADILATLTELTVTSIVESYRQFLPHPPDQVLLCGGGSRNLYLTRRLKTQLDPVDVFTTTEGGLDASAKEAIAFAVLAYWRMKGIPGNLPAVTGAISPVLLGEIHPYYAPPL
jgi:anhydro-N-acetylmuramic acid kinase